ncbi:MAG: carbohydrate kinase family protein [Gemmatimonadaceae bacterium]|nr:carbohydrate kinase family protein [Gemmatimonadaceae bacterium]
MPKKVGVIGTFVWDEIHGRDPLAKPVEEWGGITYALGALDAALSDEWEIVPILKVGYDLAARSREFMASLRKVTAGTGPIEVPHPTNRVTLQYESSERRCEYLRGGIPGWGWRGLQPLMGDLDALYINMISGFEIDLETAQLIRQNFRGPIYCDLHSLLLAVQPDGARTLQPLPNAEAWLRCFDVVQVNEDEMSMLARDGMDLAAKAFTAGVQCLIVTMGSRGAVYFAAPGFESIADLRRDTIGGRTGAIRTALIPAKASRDMSMGDPTGCGDVWGATYFSRLLAGDKLDKAMEAAMNAAAKNVDHRGATGLAGYLRGELSFR